jgi:hypothetical protein
LIPSEESFFVDFEKLTPPKFRKIEPKESAEQIQAKQYIDSIVK